MTRRTVRQGAQLDAEAEAGIGLVEIVVSMFLVALIAMTFLPLLIRTMQTSSVNTSTATASQLLASNLDAVRALPSPTCSTITGTFVGATLSPVVDARGVSLQPHREATTACPTSYPGTVGVHVWITTSGAVTPLAEATTLVLVTGP
jgi:Tfp pilus assembly protein PilV